MTYRSFPSRATAGAASLLLCLLVASATGCSRPTASTPANTQTTPANTKTTEQRIDIKVVKGPVFWRKDRTETVGQELEVAEMLRSLPAGAWVRCGPGGEVHIYQTPDFAVHKGSDWRPLPHLTTADKEEVRKAREGLFRVAGRLRSERARVFSPQPGSQVWPASLVFRWSPRPAKKNVVLTLQETASAKSLWNKKDIDGANGLYEDLQACAALRSWRDEHGDGVERLTLIFQDDEGTVKVPFDLLTREQEKELESALVRWDADTQGLLRHLGRAEVFFQRNLLPESAAEYEDALKRNPDDQAVRKRTAEAFRMIDDLASARHLEERKDAP